MVAIPTLCCPQYTVRPTHGEFVLWNNALALMEWLVYIISMASFYFHIIMQSLIKLGRVLVGEGVLTKLCRKKAKPRQFFLFNDILVYGNIVLDKKKVLKCSKAFLCVANTLNAFARHSN